MFWLIPTIITLLLLWWFRRHGGNTILEVLFLAPFAAFAIMGVWLAYFIIKAIVGAF